MTDLHASPQSEPPVSSEGAVSAPLSLWGKVGLLCFGVVLCFVLLEIGMRVLGFVHIDIRTKDAANGLITFKPNQELRVKGACFDNVVVSNRYGFHAKDYEQQKEEGVFRIAIVGDSFTEAVHVPLSQTFSYLLEDRLNEMNIDGVRFEVLPFGVSSNGTYKNLLYAKEYAYDFEPDILIDLFLSGNDITDDFLDYPEYRPTFDALGNVIVQELAPFEASAKRKITQLLKRSLVVEYMYNGYLSLRAKQAVTTSGDDMKAPRIRSLYAKEYTDEWQSYLDGEEALLRAHNALAKEHGATFVVVSRARHGFLHHDEAEETKNWILAGADPDDYDFEKPERILAEITDAQAIPYLNLHPYFVAQSMAYPEATVHWSCDGHWNETGHEWASDAIFDFLTSYPDLLPSRGGVLSDCTGRDGKGVPLCQ